MPDNSYDARATLEVGDRKLDIFRLDALQSKYDVARLPFSLKVLLENLLRTEGNGSVSAEDIEAPARWDAKAEPSEEIAFTPARVVLQDFTGVPCVVDLAAMRDAIADMGGDPAVIEREARRGGGSGGGRSRRPPPSWSSTTPSRSTHSATGTRSPGTPSSSSSAT